MAKFDAETLRELREVQEVRIRTEKHPKSAIVIWVVVADDEVLRAFVARRQGALVQGPRGGRARRFGVYRPRVGGAGNPGERSRGGRPGQPRVPPEVSAEHPCAGDGALRNLADHAAARTALICASSDRTVG